MRILRRLWEPDGDNMLSAKAITLFNKNEDEKDNLCHTSNKIVNIIYVRLLNLIKGCFI